MDNAKENKHTEVVQLLENAAVDAIARRLARFVAAEPLATEPLNRLVREGQNIGSYAGKKIHKVEF